MSIATGRSRLAVVAVAVPLLAVACGGNARDSSAPLATQPQPPPATSPTEPRTSLPQPPVPPQTQTAPASREPGQPSVLPASLLGHELEQLATTSKVVALTFDAGANAAGVPSILATLRRNGVIGTFFLTGRWVKTYPQLAREIGGRYPVANHTYSHQQLPPLTDATVKSEIEQAQLLIRRATGQDPRPLFRFPYGSSDTRTIRIANSLGYTTIRWTVDTLGWEGTARGQSASSVTNRVLASLRPGEIVLMHVGSPPDGSTLDADALPPNHPCDPTPRLQARGTHRLPTNTLNELKRPHAEPHLLFGQPGLAVDELADPLSENLSVGHGDNGKGMMEE